jgi:hypothetical protein
MSGAAGMDRFGPTEPKESLPRRSKHYSSMPWPNSPTSIPLPHPARWPPGRFALVRHLSAVAVYAERGSSALVIRGLRKVATHCKVVTTPNRHHWRSAAVRTDALPEISSVNLILAFVHEAFE